MVKYKKITFLCGILCLALLTGCGKKEEIPSLTIPETTQEAITMPQETAAQADETQPQDTTASASDEVPTFNYEPGTMGIYVTADPGIEGEPGALDDLTMTLPEGVTRQRVSDRQIDFVKNGKQIGGFLLVDFPEGMLEDAAATMEGFDTMSDHLAKQTMSEIYPSEARLWGGGHISDMSFHSIVFINKHKGDKIGAQYRHYIYIGEKYCYDFWIDESSWGDSGFGLIDSLSADDIKPELNEVEFAWSLEDRPRMTP